jgi:hypothetical protein
MCTGGSGRAVAVTLAGALAVVLVVLVLALSDRDVHLAGTNNVFDRFPVAMLQRGDELCEQFETVPGDAAAVRFSVAPDSAASRGPLSVRVLDGEQVISHGKRPGGWKGESVEVPIQAVPRTITGSQVCVTNGGEAALTLRGYSVEPDRLGFTLRGEQTDQQIRLTYLRGEPESWWSVAGVVAHRFGLGRGELFGGWIVFAWLAGMLAMAVVTVKLMLREGRA